MINTTLEKKILSTFLNNPDETKKVHIEPKWFQEKAHRELAYILLNAEKQITDFSELEFEIKTLYPHSHITEDWLHQLRFEELFVSDLDSSLKTLHKSYIQAEQKKAMIRYLEHETTQNKEALEDWLRAEQEAEREDDDGRLDKDIERLIYNLDHESASGLSTFKQLDMILGNGLEGGTLVVIGARPGVGKTAYAINLALRTLQNNQNTHVDFFTLEMSSYSMLTRFITSMSSIQGYKFKKPKVRLDDTEKEQVKKHALWVKNSDLRVFKDKFKISEIERTIRRNHHKHEGKPYIAVVDYLGLVDSEMGNARGDQKIGKITRTLKLLTNELDIPIILLSQLNRGIEGRQEKTPTLSDLRESGDIEQDANVVLFLSEDDEMQGVTNLTIAKNREGTVGQIQYNFHKATMHFEELE